MKHLMLDIETLSVKSRALIWSVGLVEFDPYSDWIDDPYIFYTRRTEQLAIRRWVEGDTVRWTREKGDSVGYEKWLKMQEYDEFGETDPRALSIGQLHSAMLRHVGQENMIWCKGGSFDFACLNALFQDGKHNTPWNFRNENCMRVLQMLAHGGESEMPVMDNGVAHNAADDAVFQARWVQNLIKRFGMTEKES